MEIKRVKGITVLAPKGCFTSISEADALEEAIAQQIASGPKLLVIDCGKMTRLNSTALGVLISAHSNLIRRGSRLAFARVNKDVERILVITKLVLVFNVYPTVELAVADMTRQPDPQGT